MPEILLTGFEAYGGRKLNPSAELTNALDGSKIGGSAVRGLLLPVSFAAAKAPLEDAIAEFRPSLVVSTGLWPGEPVIRLERVAVNRASFEIPDNDGQRLRDEEVEKGGPLARAATLPVGEIIAALRQRGIPARASDTAGTYLCNTTLYRGLAACEQLGSGARCGFVHLPYLPRQVAWLLDDLSDEGRLELHQRADLASMGFETMLEALRTIIAVSLAQS
ncbi:pyroglutamyl-peptidase I Cysteine peptidase. MEROPS family C15 [Rhizobiales bacterium GAS191]|jgi:pyroglutamyl-peptidase|nr:pyroglutamyl-peptidase I Cysteine peptidase. MEROPS family C15 [Rhizobiales bacterium GAS113]SED72996.1 pyroglutamyl-peptidase I Cysteine peptidase. MEROPS family C15 [Rhizobiales bacterium GAS188]SEE80696.1 pyroglutamyl-peptidase I Cysteine peptidase. MEROPS family C15 [Rhizobiales bacterium GAS191]